VDQKGSHVAASMETEFNAFRSPRLGAYDES
jgi:hypothetical protein